MMWPFCCCFLLFPVAAAAAAAAPVAASAPVALVAAVFFNLEKCWPDLLQFVLLVLLTCLLLIVSFSMYEGYPARSPSSAPSAAPSSLARWTSFQ